MEMQEWIRKNNPTHYEEKNVSNIKQLNETHTVFSLL